jgi:hypothetical protein
MEAIRSSEPSGETKRTTRRYIPEDDTLRESEVLSGTLLLSVHHISGVLLFLLSFFSFFPTKGDFNFR